MSCQTVQDSLSEFLDRRLTGDERTRVALHLAGCRECAASLRALSEYAKQFERICRRWRFPNPWGRSCKCWPRGSAPNGTPIKPGPWRCITGRVNIKLAMDNLMRPLAVPLAGGLASALLMFGLLVPTLGFRPSVMNDVPTGLYTAATLVEVAPVGINNDEAVVELYVDAKGQATDYSVQEGSVTPRCRRTSPR